MDYLLSTNALTKRYGKHKAVDNVNLHIEKGQIYGLIGRNGAGKTTIMKMICDTAIPTSGSVSIFGCSSNDYWKYKSRIGCLIEAPGIFPERTALENLKMKAILTGINKEGYLEDILQIVGLSNIGKKKVGQFSLGMKQRLGIGIALVGEPDLLILDEPINGLDPQGIAEVRNVLLRLNKERGITIMISSHILEELSKIATHYGIIDNGKIILELSKEDLALKCRERIEICADNTEKACTILESIGIRDYKLMDRNTICVYEQLEKIGFINTKLVTGGITVTQIMSANEDLEKYFLDITGGAHNA